ncbi:MAG TPA: hypothetical protein PK331_05800 [Gordonia sp. (in: high G+C Gram-positive bacteria)]|uniref:hypothetical protein n=1 Tax=unclassified Gordonia (in: high G+C Gram-positive bacteria) TaxID=2657482 RepID=UPI000F9F1E07|nr:MULTISPECIES: hypothetical protein [unclassified Gordonia (in: high G+C Gram-positive bacteria)]RUP36786.1 MAG: hypothetical protein EKK60_14180 [Gordonia sp. (in: high G+C Gram-positive bacteria)]HNP56981.1 hypothetical protein [Gordonia sp. (in: high G+C Gram-positive bacteria)]HRC50425.1 hypothetical protein [Gordonia sp. (in: high G+C Gram-positive bacteria)]
MPSGVKTALRVLGAGLIVGAAVAAPVHAAPGDDPYAGGRNYVKTLQCPVADPWPGPPLHTWVDVWNRITYPSDGLPPPAIALVADTRREQTTMTPITEYSMWITVNWRNADNGRRGTVKLRARAPRNTWQAVLHPGRGRVFFEIHQSVTAILAVPGVNPQTAVCRGSATAV